MSVFVPTGADVAVDPLDVLLVAPNGTTRTTLYLAQGQPVVVAALPAAVVAQLDEAAGLVGDDTLFTTPVAASEWPSPVYIAGAQVKRVQPSGATNLGSMVLFALSGFMVTVPAVDLTAMMALINATTTGGGDMSYCTAYDWTPTLASEDAELTNGASCAAFIGEGGSTTVGVVHGTLQGTLTPDAAGDVSFTATLPASADEVVYVSGYANSSSAILIGGLIVGSTMSLSFVSPDTDPYAFWVLFTFRTGAA